MQPDIRKVSVITLFAFFLLQVSAGAQSQKPERILFFGDSITEAGIQPGGYVAILADSLADEHTELIGAGISGNKIGDLLDRVERDVLSHEPTAVVVYIGINDVWHWNSASGVGTTPDDFEQGLSSLVEVLRENDARVILCTPSVIGEKHDGTNEQDEMLDSYAEISRRVADRAEIDLCDLRRDFVEYLRENNRDNQAQGVLTTDGVHLNSRGNQFVAERILAVLRD